MFKPNLCHATGGVNKIIRTEKKAAEKVEEARKKRVVRLKQATIEAKAEIDKIQVEREERFQAFLRETQDSGKSAAMRVNADAQRQIAELTEKAQSHKDQVVEQILQLVCDVKPELHANYLLLKEVRKQQGPKKAKPSRFKDNNPDDPSDPGSFNNNKRLAAGSQNKSNNHYPIGDNKNKDSFQSKKFYGSNPKDAVNRHVLKNLIGSKIYVDRLFTSQCIGYATISTKNPFQSEDNEENETTLHSNISDERNLVDALDESNSPNTDPEEDSPLRPVHSLNDRPCDICQWNPRSFMDSNNVTAEATKTEAVKGQKQETIDKPILLRTSETSQMIGIPSPEIIKKTDNASKAIVEAPIELDLISLYINEDNEPKSISNKENDSKSVTSRGSQDKTFVSKESQQINNVISVESQIKPKNSEENILKSVEHITKKMSNENDQSGITFKNIKEESQRKIYPYKENDPVSSNGSNSSQQRSFISRESQQLNVITFNDKLSDLNAPNNKNQTNVLITEQEVSTNKNKKLKRTKEISSIDEISVHTNSTYEQQSAFSSISSTQELPNDQQLPSNSNLKDAKQTKNSLVYSTIISKLPLYKDISNTALSEFNEKRTTALPKKNIVSSKIQTGFLDKISEDILKPNQDICNNKIPTLFETKEFFTDGTKKNDLINIQKKRSEKVLPRYFERIDEIETNDDRTEAIQKQRNQDHKLTNNMLKVQHVFFEHQLADRLENKLLKTNADNIDTIYAEYTSRKIKEISGIDEISMHSNSTFEDDGLSFEYNPNEIQDLKSIKYETNITTGQLLEDQNAATNRFSRKPELGSITRKKILLKTSEVSQYIGIPIEISNPNVPQCQRTKAEVGSIDIKSEPNISTVVPTSVPTAAFEGQKVISGVEEISVSSNIELDYLNIVNFSKQLPVEQTTKNPSVKLMRQDRKDANNPLVNYQVEYTDTSTEKLATKKILLTTTETCQYIGIPIELSNESLTETKTVSESHQLVFENHQPVIESHNPASVKQDSHINKDNLKNSNDREIMGVEDISVDTNLFNHDNEDLYDSKMIHVKESHFSAVYEQCDICSLQTNKISSPNTAQIIIDSVNTSPQPPLSPEKHTPETSQTIINSVDSLQKSLPTPPSSSVDILQKSLLTPPLSSAPSEKNTSETAHPIIDPVDSIQKSLPPAPSEKNTSETAQPIIDPVDSEQKTLPPPLSEKHTSETSQIIINPIDSEQKSLPPPLPEKHTSETGQTIINLVESLQKSQSAPERHTREIAQTINPLDTEQKSLSPSGKHTSEICQTSAPPITDVNKCSEPKLTSTSIKRSNCGCFGLVQRKPLNEPNCMKNDIAFSNILQPEIKSNDKINNNDSKKNCENSCNQRQY